MKRKLKFNQAINEAIYQAMKSDKKIVCYSLDDPEGFYSERLVEEFGNDRVFDIPTSENALTEWL